MITLAVDCMGGDHGPRVTLEACEKFLATHADAQLLLVGKSEVLAPWVSRPRVTVIEASEVVAMDDPIEIALRKKKDSSMRVAIQQVKDGKADVAVSAGNTGALMAIARYLLKTIEGIDRPAIASQMPQEKGGATTVLDLGANVDCSAEHLLQFAVMGSALVSALQDGGEPTVGLLNIGEEEVKGLDSIRDASAVLKTIPSINYIGYLEANELLTGKTDVLVCDGFTGNVTLKTMEGVVRMFLSLLKSQGEGKKRSWWLLLLKRWLQKSLSRRFSHLNPDQYNGACLLGLRGSVIKSHGAANQRAFCVAIEQAVQAVQRQVPQRIAARLESVYPAGFELLDGGKSGTLR